MHTFSFLFILCKVDLPAQISRKFNARVFVITLLGYCILNTSIYSSLTNSPNKQDCLSLASLYSLE